MKSLSTLAIAATTALGLTFAAGAAHATDKDIVDTAVEAGQFTTLAAALTEAGLVDALKGDGPFTVFAPTDAAFAKLPEGTVEGLLKPENRDQLVAILTYHVVGSELMSGEIPGGMTEVMSLNGDARALQVNKSADGVMINDATVTMADIEASNGVIHVIDSVILPPSE